MRTFERLIIEKPLSAVKRYYEKYKHKSELTEFSSTRDKNLVFRSACNYKQLDVALWLYELHDDIEFDYQDIGEDTGPYVSYLKYIVYEYGYKVHARSPFIDACCLGNIDVAKWLLNMDPNINISAGKESAMFGICRRGDIEMAKWLLEVKHDIKLTANNHCILRVACEKGYMNIVKWLLELYPHLDPHTTMRSVFIIACTNGQLEIAQLLYNMCPKCGRSGIGNSDCNDSVLEDINRNGHGDVAKWFLEKI